MNDLELIRQYLDDNHITQTAAATLMGYSRVHVSHVLNGNRPLDDAFKLRFYNTFFLGSVDNPLSAIVQEAA